MSNKIIIFCSVVSICIFCPAFISMTFSGIPSGSQPLSVPLDLGYVPGELLVRFAPKADGTQLSMTEKSQIMSSLGETTVKGNYRIVPGLSHVKLSPGTTVEHAIAQLNTKEGIMYAQPNHYLMLCSIPNDPEFGNLWGMHNNGGGGRTLDADIDAPEAWNIETDASEIIVAVIDSGVDYTHEDLAANMWVNELELNGTPDHDDDGNFYKDDIYGYDFCTWGGKEQ